MYTENSNGPMARDIAALNRQALELIARYASSNPVDACLKLNCSLSHMKVVSQLSSEAIASISNLDQFLLQPAIEPSSIQMLARLNSEQAVAHFRSVTRLHQWS